MHVPTPSLRTRARRIAATVLGLADGSSSLAWCRSPRSIPATSSPPTPRHPHDRSRVFEPPTIPRPVPRRTPVVVETRGIRRVVAAVQRRAARILGFAIVGVNARPGVRRTTASSSELEWAGRMPTSTSIPATPVPTIPCTGRSATPVPSPATGGTLTAMSAPTSMAGTPPRTGTRGFSRPMSRSAGSTPMPIASRRGTWWLDVETANSWIDHTLNVASLHGAVDFLESMEVEEVGFYSTPLLWWRVTPAPMSSPTTRHGMPAARPAPAPRTDVRAMPSPAGAADGPVGRGRARPQRQLRVGDLGT